MKVPNEVSWTLLLAAKSEFLKANLSCFILCTLIEDFMITRNLAQFSVRKPDSSLLSLFKGELFHVLDTLIDTSELSITLKHTLFAELEAEADVQRALIWSHLSLGEEVDSVYKEIFKHDLFKRVAFSGLTELGLLFRYIQGYFGIKFKAGLLKSVNNDKYHLLLHPSPRSLDPEDAYGPRLVQHEAAGMLTYGERALESVLHPQWDPVRLDQELMALEHVFSYSYSFGLEPCSLVRLLCLKALADALDPRSVSAGKPWIDKAMSVVASSQM